MYSERFEGSDRELVDGASVDVRNHEMSMVRVSEYEITKSHVRSIPCVGFTPRVFEQRLVRVLQELFGSCKKQSWKHGLLRSDSPVRQISSFYMYIVVLRRTFLKWGCV